MRGGRLQPRSNGEAVPLNALRDSDRALLIGMGGGGDVVGALAITDLLDGLGTEWVLGGVAWERSPIDPRPGPRSLDEIRGGRRCGSAAVLTEGSTTSLDGVEFSENRGWPRTSTGRFCCSTSPGALGPSPPASPRPQPSASAVMRSWCSTSGATCSPTATSQVWRARSATRSCSRPAWLSPRRSPSSARCTDPAATANSPRTRSWSGSPAYRQLVRCSAPGD